MSYNRLTTAEMITLTGPWLDAAHPAQAALRAVPALAPLLPHVADAHQGLLKTQPGPPSGQLPALVAEQETVDVTHDNLARALYHLTTGLGFATADSAEATAWLTLRDFLFPDGLALVNRSYREEAGAAALLEARITADQKKRLKGQSLGKQTLHDLYQDFLKAAARLGQLEDERSRLDTTSGASPSEVVAMRHRWIRAVSAVVATIQLAGETAALKEHVLKPLQQSEQKSDRRRPKKTDPNTPDPALTDPDPTRDPPATA